MISIKINGIPFFSQSSISILDACKNFGVNIPRFCYHELLSVSGNCRMCLVEVEGLEKPIASCVAEVEPNMSIWLDTPFVKKARENVVETILMHHPLDCPICDQAGECDLQDIAYTYGASSSRFDFNKEPKVDLFFNNKIDTVMQRCIKCTRCVRYADEITDNFYFGTLNRGRDTEISSFVGSIYDSELSGNVIDLCPVGALNQSNRAYKARPWHLRVLESFDDTDSMCSDVYLFYDDESVHKVLPKNQTSFRGGLITDKARYKFDNEFLSPFFNVYSRKKKARFQNSNYSYDYNEIFKIFNAQLKKTTPLSVFLNENVDIQTLLLLKSAENSSGGVNKSNIKLTNVDRLLFKSNFYIGDKYAFFKDTIAEDAILFVIGSNFQYETLILNTRMKALFKRSNMINSYETTFASDEWMSYDDAKTPEHLINLSLLEVAAIFEGKCAVFSKLLKKTSKLYLLVGTSINERIVNSDDFLLAIRSFCKSIRILRLGLHSNSDGLDWLNIKNFITPQKRSARKSTNIELPTSLSVQDETGSMSNDVSSNFKGMKFVLSPFLSKVSSCDFTIPYKNSKETKKRFLNFEHLSKSSNSPKDGVPYLKRYKLKVVIKQFLDLPFKEHQATLFKYMYPKIKTKNNPFCLRKYLKFNNFKVNSTKCYLEPMSLNRKHSFGFNS